MMNPDIVNNALIKMLDQNKVKKATGVKYEVRLMRNKKAGDTGSWNNIETNNIFLQKPRPLLALAYLSLPFAIVICFLTKL